MRHPQTESTTSNIQLLLSYVADLELEVDRLRKQSQFIRHETRGTLKRIQTLCATGGEQSPVAEIGEAVTQLAEILRDLQEVPGYHPAHDQVTPIAFRPLVELVFRWQQRLERAPQVVLRFEMEVDHLEWFPGRLRHLLDNILGNSLKYRDPTKVESWVKVGLRASPESYELRIADNGVGMPAAETQQVFELFYRATPARAAGLGVGLAVAKLLVEQSGGTLAVDSGEGQGTTFVAVLPRFDLEDYLL